MGQRGWAAAAGVAALVTAVTGAVGNHLPWPGVMSRHPLWTTSIFFAGAITAAVIGVALFVASRRAEQPRAERPSTDLPTAVTAETANVVATDGGMVVGHIGTLVLGARTLPATAEPKKETHERTDSVFEIPRAAESRPFAGRNDELTWIRDALRGDGSVAAITQTRAITGLGGVGKSRLAREYALRHRGDYEVVWWIRAQDSTLRDGDFAGLARRLNLCADETPLEEAKMETRRWLASTDVRWLLVFDNAEELDDVLSLLPTALNGHVLVTTRRTDWALACATLPLDVLPRPDSVGLLLSRTGDADQDSADNLADALGDLPLALEQAAAYCVTRRLSLAAYLDRYRARARDLLAEGNPVDYPATVATTWALAFDEIQQTAPTAAVLLNLCSLLAPDAIPRDLFRSAPQKALLIGDLVDPLQLDGAVAVLAGYSLVDATDTAITVHRLVQEVTRSRLSPKLHAPFRNLLLVTIVQGFPDARWMPAWQQAMRLIPHARVILKGTEADEGTALLRGTLLNEVGLALDAVGRREPALEASTQAVSIFRELVRNRDELRVFLAGSLNNLGAVLGKMGQSDRALAAIDEASRIYGDLATIEPERYRPNLAMSLNNLSNALDQLGRGDDALAASEQAVDLYRGLAVDDRSYRVGLAMSLNNLGTVLKKMDRDNDALTALSEAVTLHRDLAADEPDSYSPYVATSLTNLGNVLAALGQYDAALVALEESVTSLRQLALSHTEAYRSDLVKSLGVLAWVLDELGRADDAELARTEAQQLSET